MERWIAWILFGLPLAGLGCKDSQAAPAQEVSPPPRAVEAPKVPEEQAENAAPEEPAPAESAPPAPVTLVISAVGDCTLGTDYRVVRAPGTFHKEMDAVGNDFKYPFSGVIEVLEEDDLTIANLETTLSSATSWIEAPFVFSGQARVGADPQGGQRRGRERGNNHSHDLGPRGHADTLRALEEHGVGYFGYGHVDRRVIKGIEIVNLGYTGGRSTIRDAVARAVRENKRADTSSSSRSIGALRASTSRSTSRRSSARRPSTRAPTWSSATTRTSFRAFTAIKAAKSSIRWAISCSAATVTPPIKTP
jgi:hypothetical protein